MNKSLFCLIVVVLLVSVVAVVPSQTLAWDNPIFGTGFALSPSSWGGRAFNFIVGGLMYWAGSRASTPPASSDDLSQFDKKGLNKTQAVASKIVDRYAPTGLLDSASCTVILGWAYDQDDMNTATLVQLTDGIGPNRKLLGTAVAILVSAEAVKLFGPQAAHVFAFNTPVSLKDNTTHQIYAYALNVNSDGTNKAVLLPGSPKTIKCPAELRPRADNGGFFANAFDGILNMFR